MDLRQFYRKIRDIESTIAEQFPLIMSLNTDDGGKEGVLAEVPRYQAARMIVEGRARLATDSERKEHQDQVAAIQRAHEEWEAARRQALGIFAPPDTKNIAKKEKPSGK
jgi:hypothetical protein